MIIHAVVPDFPISVIIPTLDEAVALPAALHSLEGQSGGPPFEAILADGGSRDGTVERFETLTRGWAARGWGARVVTAPHAGRGIQMNAGANAARGAALLFLHADTRLPAGAHRAIVSALADPKVMGGGFRLRYEESGVFLRVVSAYATLRSRLTRIHYGDQAIFVRRCAFRAVAGFPEIPLFEDLSLAVALRRAGRVVTLAMYVTTSARRLRHGGVGRTAARFAWCKIRFALGADPARIKADYPDVR